MRLVFGEGNKVSVRLPIKRKKKSCKGLHVEIVFKTTKCFNNAI